MIKNDIGFVIPSLTNDQRSSSLCDIINALIIKNKSIQFCIFNQYCDLIDCKNVPLIAMSHARYFNGDLFVLDFPSLVITTNFPNIKNIYYFTNSMPWAEQYNEYNVWKKIFNKSNIKVFSTNESVCDIYNIVWENETKLIKEINYETITSIIR